MYDLLLLLSLLLLISLLPLLDLHLLYLRQLLGCLDCVGGGRLGSEGGFLEADEAAELGETADGRVLIDEDERLLSEDLLVEGDEGFVRRVSKRALVVVVVIGSTKDAGVVFVVAVVVFS